MFQKPPRKLSIESWLFKVQGILEKPRGSGHHPLINLDLPSNFWAKNHREKKTYQKRQIFLTYLEDAGIYRIDEFSLVSPDTFFLWNTLNNQGVPELFIKTPGLMCSCQGLRCAPQRIVQIEDHTSQASMAKGGGRGHGGGQRRFFHAARMIWCHRFIALRLWNWAPKRKRKKEGWM